MSDIASLADKAERCPENSHAEFTPPEYTMKEIYKAIPPHCLRPNTLLSLYYVLRDFFFAATLISLATQIPNIIPSSHPYFQGFAWFSYAFLQGLVFTGLWELAHECGHGALSEYRWFNNSAGLLIHSLLLVPFHSWRITHGQHHKSTNNLERDIAFVPLTKEDYEKKHESHSKILDYVEDMPIVALAHLFVHQIVAWPIYLTINNFAIERMAATKWWKRSHFYIGGDGPNFKPSNTRDVLISDIGIAAVGLILWTFGRYFGTWNLFLFYGLPWMWTNHWIRKLISSSMLNKHPNF